MPFTWGVLACVFGKFTIGPKLGSHSMIYWLRACKVDNPGSCFISDDWIKWSVIIIFQPSVRTSSQCLVNAFVDAWPAYINPFLYFGDCQLICIVQQCLGPLD